MNSRLFFIILLIIAGVAAFSTVAKPKPQVSPPIPSDTRTDYQPVTLATQSKTAGVVNIKITPLSPVTGTDLVFDLTMDNHSIDLDYDYTQIATLTDEQGNRAKPTEWTGNSGGHHTTGQLIFPALPGNPQQLVLILEGVDNQTVDFSWQL